MIKPLSPTGKAVFGVVNAAGIAAYAWAVARVARDQLAAPNWEYLALLAAALAAGWMTLKLPGIGSFISVSDAFVFSAVIFFGPAPAALIAGTEGFLATRKHSGRLLSAFSSLSILTLTALASGTVYERFLVLLAGGRAGPPAVEFVFVALGAMALAHYLMNSSLVALLTSFARRVSPWRLWKESYLWTSVSFFAGAAAAGVAYLFVREAGALGLVLAIPIIGLSYAAYRGTIERLEQQNRRIAQMNEVHLRTIEALATAIDAKGQAAEGHLQRVQVYAVGLARLAGADEATVEGVRAAALLHDVGKIAVPDYIINKPGPLTPAELAKVRSYPRFSAEILRYVDFPYEVLPFVRSHRERWDGSGYPDGLAGEQIPLGARIVAIADCIDSLLSERPWREPFSKEAAIAFLEREAGRAFDPQLVRLFCGAFEELFALATAVEHPESGGLQEIRSVLREHAAHLYRATVSKEIVDDIGATRREALALYDLARDLGASVGLDETLEVVMAKLRRLLDFDTGVIYLLDGDSRLILPAYVDGVGADTIRRKSLRRGEGLTGWAMENGRTVVNAKPELDFYGPELDVGARFASAAVTPLASGKSAIGTITLYDRRPDHFTAEHERILETIGPQVAAAVESARSFEETRNRALTDLLTGLPNSRFLYAQLERELARARRQRSTLAVVVLDLDRFKPVNDSLGHHVGDEVLRQIAAALTRLFRAGDVTCRWAGDEFVVLMPDVDDEQVGRIVRRAQRAIDEMEIPTSTGRSVRVGLSAGWAVFPADGQTFKELIAAADRRMYADKSKRHRQRSKAGPALSAR